MPRWARSGALAVLVCWSSGCIPPGVEDFVEEEPPETIVVNFSKIIPQEHQLTISRSPEDSLAFQVYEAFTHSDQTSELVYYWYIDWSVEHNTAPQAGNSAVYNFRPCDKDADPPNPTDGNYPDTRRLMVVASTSELEVPDKAYLGSAESSDVLFHVWTINLTNQSLNPCLSDPGVVVP